MLSGILILVCTGLAWSFTGVVLSLTTKSRFNLPTVYACKLAISLVAALFIFPDYGAIPSIYPDLWKLCVVMIPAGIAGGLGILVLQRAMTQGHHGISWAIGQSALVVPFVAGIVLFSEPATGFRLAGVLAILASLMLFGRARQSNRDATNLQAVSKPVLGFWLALLALFILGVQQTLVTLPSHLDSLSDTARLRVPLLFTGSGSVYIVLFARRPSMPKPRELTLALFGAAIGITGQFLLFSGLDILAGFGAALIGFPVAVGTCIIGFAAYSFIAMREEFTAFHIAGIISGMAGIISISI